jgi:hypothetical protein
LGAEFQSFLQNSVLRTWPLDMISFLPSSFFKELHMTVNDVLAAGLRQGLGMLKMHIADFSDAELLVRPVPGANHANWQLGHLITSETQMLGACGAAMPALPAGFADRYSKENTRSDDPGKFATKAELLAVLEKTRAASVAFVQSATPAQLAAPSPMKDMFPTVADFMLMGATHDAMHIGQIQVLRRKLGKPMLF